MNLILVLCLASLGSVDAGRRFFSTTPPGPPSSNPCDSGNGGCEHICSDNGGGSVTCSCGSGYSLDSDQQSCNDINECSGSNACEQYCTNTIGSYTCYCARHFALNGDGASCRLVCFLPFVKIYSACWFFNLPNRTVSQSYAHSDCVPDGKIAYFTSSAQFRDVRASVRSRIAPVDRTGRNMWTAAKETGPNDTPRWVWYPSNNAMTLASIWHTGRPKHQHRCGAMYGEVNYDLVDVKCPANELSEMYGWICRANLAF